MANRRILAVDLEELAVQPGITAGGLRIVRVVGRRAKDGVWAFARQWHAAGNLVDFRSMIPTERKRRQAKCDLTSKCVGPPRSTYFSINLPVAGSNSATSSFSGIEAKRFVPGSLVRRPIARRAPRTGPLRNCDLDCRDLLSKLAGDSNKCQNGNSKAIRRHGASSKKSGTKTD